MIKLARAVQPPAARWRPNVTVAALIEQGGRFLLVEENTDDGLRLNTPAGHLEPGESPAEGCARETLEETAHPFAPTALVGIYMAGAQRRTVDKDITYLRFAFAGTLGAQVPGRALDEGIVHTLWMSPDEIRASIDRHRSPLLLQCVEDYLSTNRLDYYEIDSCLGSTHRRCRPIWHGNSRPPGDKGASNAKGRPRFLPGFLSHFSCHARVPAARPRSLRPVQANACAASITAPPRQTSPAYSTADWPGVTAHWGVSKSSRSRARAGSASVQGASAWR